MCAVDHSGLEGWQKQERSAGLLFGFLTAKEPLRVQTVPRLAGRPRLKLGEMSCRLDRKMVGGLGFLPIF